MSEYVIAEEGSIAPGERLVVQLEGREIAVFNVDGEYRAYTNWCPHQSGPVCEGNITGTWEAEYDKETMETTEFWTRKGEILNCPWHGWEFEVDTGECLSRNKVKLISHDVEALDGDIVLSL